MRRSVTTAASAPDWPAICAALKRISYQGTWTFEVIQPRYGESPETLAELTRTVARQWGL